MKNHIAGFLLVATLILLLIFTPSKQDIKIKQLQESNDSIKTALSEMSQRLSDLEHDFDTEGMKLNIRKRLQ